MATKKKKTFYVFIPGEREPDVVIGDGYVVNQATGILTVYVEDAQGNKTEVYTAGHGKFNRVYDVDVMA